jgi:hypothetical protein
MRNRTILVLALAVCSLGVVALLSVPGNGAFGYAPFAALLLSLSLIVSWLFGKARETRTLPQLVSASEAGIPERHDGPQWKSNHVH